MSSQTIVTIVLGVLEIASFSIMSRLLSPEDFGYYATISAVTIVFASFSETGIGAAIIQRKNLEEKFVNNAFTLSLIFGCIIALMLIILAYPLSLLVADSSMMIPLMLMSVTLLANCLISVNTSIMYRRLEFLKVGLINLIALIITTVVAIVLAMNDFGYYAILAKAILTSLLTLIISSFFAKTNYKIELDKETFHTIFGFSGWLMASVFFRNLSHQMDKLLMTRMLSVNALGAYNRPKEFITHISAKFGSIFDTALFPVLSQIQDNRDSIKRAYLKSMYLLNLASIILAFGFIFNGSLIIRIFFGSDWMSVLGVFQILSFSIIFSFDARLADCYLRSLGLTKQQFCFRIVEVIVKVIGLFIGFRWGIIGVAMSVLIADVIMILSKHLYLSTIINITAGEGVTVLLKAWRGNIIILPFMLVIKYLLPESYLGDGVILFSYCILLAIVYLICPGIAGPKYKELAYPALIKIINKIKNRCIR